MGGGGADVVVAASVVAVVATTVLVGSAAGLVVDLLADPLSTTIGSPDAFESFLPDEPSAPTMASRATQATTWAHSGNARNLRHVRASGLAAERWSLSLGATGATYAGGPWGAAIGASVACTPSLLTALVHCCPSQYRYSFRPYGSGCQPAGPVLTQTALVGE